jgi:agmatine deiminase
MKRRQFFDYTMFSLTAIWISHLTQNEITNRSMQSTSTNKKLIHKWSMPGEFEPHERCWMAFPSSEEIWREVLPQGKGIIDLQRDVATIANTIALFEPVTILVNPEAIQTAKKLIGDRNITFLEIPINDLWTRDTGPLFVTSPDKKLTALSGNFNGWGNKQKHDRDAFIAKKIAKNLNIEAIELPIVLEGGAICIDGQGTLITTESNILHLDRNPNLTKTDAEEIFRQYLGIEKVLWHSGVANADITDGHIDGLIAYARPGVILIDWTDDIFHPQYEELKELRQMLEASTDARGRKLEIIPLQKPLLIQDSSDFFDSYINFYIANGGIIMPSFGDKESDIQARRTIQTVFPDRLVSQVKIDTMMAFGGGAIHCATQQQPRV